MILLKTNILGFKKDKKTGVLVNTDVDKISAIKEKRKNYKRQKGIELIIEKHESLITDLIERVKKLEKYV